MSLKKQAVSGIIWTFLNLFLTRGASFIATVFLAKILGPDDFGLLGMIAIFMGIGSTLVDSGLSASLIRSVDVDEMDYCTVFYTNLGLSGFVYLVVFTIAPYVAVFYNQEILTNIIRVYCVGFVISATVAIHTAILTRELEFKKLTKYQVPATIISVTVGILLAYFGYGVWSLVWMFLINQVVRSLIFWYKSKWRPILVFDFVKLKKHFGFGYKLTLSSLMNTGCINIYNILIGKYYALDVLGYFERSQTFQLYIVSTITDVISNVSYPLLAKIQNDKERMIFIFKRLIVFTFFIVAPVMLGLSVLASPLFQIVLGEKWMRAVPFFQILCLSGVLYPLHFLNINLLKVLGRSDLFLKLEIYKQFALVLVIIISFQYGINGLLLSTVISSIISFFINTYYTNKLIDYGAKKQLIDLFPYLLISLITSVGMYFVFKNLEHLNLFIQFIIPAIVGFIFYILLNYIFKLEALSEVLDIIKTKKQNV